MAEKHAGVKNLTPATVIMCWIHISDTYIRYIYHIHISHTCIEYMYKILPTSHKP